MKHAVKYKPSSRVVAGKAPYQVNELIKEIQDTVYNVASKYLKAEGWDASDVADYFRADVQQVEPGVIRAEIRGELHYEELSELCSQLDKVIAVKFDRDAYFEPVEPGIAEAFIRTKVKACSNVTASASSQFTMQDVQALIDDYGTEYFEATPTSGGRKLWFCVFDVGSYNIRIEDGKIIMISTDDPNDDVRIFRSLEDFRDYLEKQIAIVRQKMDMNYCANASTLVTSSLNYVTPEMKQLKRAISKIYVDNDDQFHELVDSLLSNEPINLVPETRALKRAIDSLVVDSEEEKRTLVYEVAKDLGVINSSYNVDVYCADAIDDDAVDDIDREFERIDRSGTDEEVEIAAVMYNLGITMKEARETLPTLSEDKIKDYVYFYSLRDLPVRTRLELYNDYKNGKNISSSSTSKPSIVAYDQIEDGWGTDVRGILDIPFARAEDLMYEIRNTIRGAYTDCETVEDLADYIRQLASEFEEAADELESL